MPRDQRPHTAGQCHCGLIHSASGVSSVNGFAAQLAALPAGADAIVSATLDAVAPVASVVLQALRDLIADKDAEIAGLKSEVDRYHGRTVFFCLDHNATHLMDEQPPPESGSVLRATDTGREWVYDRGEWAPR